MSLIDVFCTQTVSIKPFVRQGSGEPIYGEIEQRKCRLERGLNIKTVYKNPDGQIYDTVAKARMYCTGASILPRSIVAHNGIEYTVINCVVANGFADDHLEVFLQ